MASSTLTIIGYKPFNDKWYQMKAVWDACKAAKIDVPDEVKIFFEDGEPNDDGKIGTPVRCAPGSITGVERFPTDGGGTGLQIDLRLLPEDVKILQIY